MQRENQKTHGFHMGKPKNTAKTDSRFRFSSMENGLHNPFHLSFQTKTETNFVKKINK